VRLTGIGALAAQFSNVKLEEIYIAPTLRRYAGASLSPVGAMEQGDPKQTFSVEEALAPSRRTVVLGTAGSGKTTLLSKLLLSFANPKSAQGPLPAEYRLPIFLSLRELPDAPDALPEMLDQRCRKGGIIPPSGFFRRVLEDDGRAVILLDGLDEVVPKERRTAVAKWINEMVAAFPMNRWVVASRPHGWEQAPVRGFDVFEMEPFSDCQMRDFLRCWHEIVVARRDPTRPIEEVHTVARTEADQVIQHVLNDDSLRLIARIPLLLSIIALLKMAGGSPPRRRTDLFERCSAVALEEWDAAIGLKDPYGLSWHQKETILAPIARWIQQSGDYCIVLTEHHTETLSLILAEMGIYGTADTQHVSAIEGILAWIGERSGLIERLDEETITFTHRSFQEYFAARDLDLQQQNGIEEAVEYANDAYWFETIRLYSGLQYDSTHLLYRILALASEQEDNFHLVVLASACFEEAHRVSDEVRQMLHNEIVRAADVQLNAGEVPRDLIHAIRLHAKDAVTQTLYEAVRAGHPSISAQMGSATLLCIDCSAWLPELREVISDEKTDVEVRSDIIDGMAEGAGPTALPALLEAVSISELGEQAVQTIGRLGESGVAYLSQVLRTGDHAQQLAAIRALGASGSAAAVTTLMDYATTVASADLEKAITAELMTAGHRLVDIQPERVEQWQELFRPASTVYTRYGKRFMDIATSVLAMLIAAPIMLLCAIAIKLTSAGPVFYRQSRVGKNGRLFALVKLRTMAADAEKETGAVWAAADDPRVTRIGRILRTLCIDELPQLWNVLKGDMSVVGPRPERPQFVAQFAKMIPFYEQRLQVSQGITGWAQVNQGYDTSLEDVVRKLRHDIYYVRHVSLVLDLQIIVQTLLVTFRATGAR